MIALEASAALVLLLVDLGRGIEKAPERICRGVGDNEKRGIYFPPL